MTTRNEWTRAELLDLVRNLIEQASYAKMPSPEGDGTECEVYRAGFISTYASALQCMVDHGLMVQTGTDSVWDEGGARFVVVEEYPPEWSVKP